MFRSCVNSQGQINRTGPHNDRTPEQRGIEFNGSQCETEGEEVVAMHDAESDLRRVGTATQDWNEQPTDYAVRTCNCRVKNTFIRQLHCVSNTTSFQYTLNTY